MVDVETLIELFQFFDPTTTGPFVSSAILVGFYILFDRRLRRVENALSRIEGRLEREK